MRPIISPVVCISTNGADRLKARGPEPIAIQVPIVASAPAVPMASTRYDTLVQRGASSGTSLCVSVMPARARTMQVSPANRNASPAQKTMNAGLLLSGIGSIACRAQHEIEAGGRERDADADDVMRRSLTRRLARLIWTPGYSCTPSRDSVTAVCRLKVANPLRAAPVQKRRLNLIIGLSVRT